MLYLIGLGLGDVKDITVKGLEIVRKCQRVYLEHYTSVLGSCTKEELEAFFDREGSNEDEILKGASTDDVAVLVVGDPFGATTHHDLMLRAKEKGIETKAIHNA